MAADPHNVVRLILPRHQSGVPGNRYDDAAAELASWLADGILVPDRAPALYVYEQLLMAEQPEPPAAWPAQSPSRGALSQPGHRVQRGLIGAVGLVPPAAGVIRPHEAVAAGPVAGRRHLMEVTRANLDPIFLLYHGAPDGAAIKIVQEAAFCRAPLAEALTPDDVRHRLWAVTDTAELAAIAADLAPRTAFIADGHHRYAAYLQLQERCRAAAGAGPWDRGLALLVDAAAYPPRLGAIHRVIPGLPPDSAVMLAAAGFKVRELPAGTADLAIALRELAFTGQHCVAFLAAGGGRAYLLADPDPVLVEGAIAADSRPLWRRLPAAVLRDVLMSRLWGVADAEPGVQAVHDAAAAVRAADEPPGGTAVICNPMAASDIYALAARGQMVPRKSTSFGPKPRTGLVMRTFAHG